MACRVEGRPKYGGRVAPALQLSEADRQRLQEIVRQRTAPQQLVLRARIILAAAEGLSNREISSMIGLSEDMVGLWRQRWFRDAEIPLLDDKSPRDERGVADRLRDEPRPGAPPRISAEQYCQIMAVACENPENSGRPITHWTTGELVSEVIQRGIVETISPRQVGRFFKRCGSKTAPHTVLAGSRAGRAAGGQNRGDLRDL